MTRRTGPDPVTRRLVLERDMGCVLCGSTLWLQTHHRRPRGMGGTRRADANSPSVLVTLCRGCHATTESRREHALDQGLLLSQHVTDPAACPVVWHGRTVLLLADGTVEDVTPEWLS